MGGRIRIKLKCPGCAALVDVTGIAPGRQVLCIKCERVISVPDPAKARRATRTPRKVEQQPPPPPAPVAIPDDSALWDSDELDDSGGNPRLMELQLDAPVEDELAGFKDEDGWIDWNKRRQKKPPGKPAS